MDTVVTGSHVSLTLHGRDDIAGGSAVLQYRKPGANVDAELPVTILDASQASCQAEITAAIHDTPGIWKAWLKTTNSLGRVAYGRVYRFRSLRPGT